jgi:hypothetical protein
MHLIWPAARGHWYSAHTIILKHLSLLISGWAELDHEYAFRVWRKLWRLEKEEVDVPFLPLALDRSDLKERVDGGLTFPWMCSSHTAAATHAQHKSISQVDTPLQPWNHSLTERSALLRYTRTRAEEMSVSCVITHCPQMAEQVHSGRWRHSRMPTLSAMQLGEKRHTMRESSAERDVMHGRLPVPSQITPRLEPLEQIPSLPFLCGATAHDECPISSFMIVRAVQRLRR